jgi:GH25 family lysozyme M1 (1,4-beta-N-acetylmuramidase)
LIDWQTLKAKYGITFGACKAIEGMTVPLDEQFPANWTKLKNAGLVRMAYDYGHPVNDPVAEASRFLGYVLDQGSLLPTDLLMLDLETGDGKSQAQVNAWVKAWAAKVTTVTGRKPILYAGHAYMENQTGVGLNGPFSAWWYPRYPDRFVDTTSWPQGMTPILPSPNAWGGPPDFWQFTESFVTSQGKIDANVYDGTLAQLRSING